MELNTFNPTYSQKSLPSEITFKLARNLDEIKTVLKPFDFLKASKQ